MLAVLNKYKIFLIILTLILLVALLCLFIAWQGRERIPSRGVFVVAQTGLPWPAALQGHKICGFETTGINQGGIL